MSAPPRLTGGFSACKREERLALPLFAHPQEQTICWRQERAINQGQFLSHVLGLARQLPDKPYAVNLCEDRYLFMVAFCAALVRGQANLLPNSRVGSAVAECVRRFPVHYRITDTHVDERPYSMAEATSQPQGLNVFQIPSGQIAAVLFTSGSTGVPKPHQQCWGDLVARAKVVRNRLHLTSSTSIVATVPPQHMFGLETSILLPLVSSAKTCAECPFFPEDIRAALNRTPSPRVLVTTPIHLRACLDTGLAWPELRFVLSATATMPRDLAQQAEQHLHAPLIEIYGSTETGAMATRRTVRDEIWQLCDGLTLRQESCHTTVSGPNLPGGFVLQDYVEVVSEGCIRLLGRHSDLVNIAGKRGSIGDLTQKMLEIDGVRDVVIVAVDETGKHLSRLCGIVVAPGLSKEQILNQLAKKVDPVFLPRPLYKASNLGRAESGKLARNQIWSLIHGLQKHPDRRN